MSYKEYIYTICNEADLTKPEDAEMLAKVLARDLLRHFETVQILEKKLEEIMTAKEYHEFIKETSKEIFQNELNRMENSEFKEYVIEHMDEITGGKGNDSRDD